MKGLGGYGELVENPDELPSAIERAVKMERPALLNIQVQRQSSPRGEAAINRWKTHSPEPI